jgi:Transglutaminase-like superfamily
MPNPGPVGSSKAPAVNTPASLESSTPDVSPETASDALPEHSARKDEGFEIGGSVSVFGQVGRPPEDFTLRYPGMAPSSAVLSVGARGALVLTNQNEGRIRSLDLVIDARTDGNGTADGAAPFHGWSNVGLNTGKWRFTLSAGTEPAFSLPAMAKLQAVRRGLHLSALGNTKLDVGLRLSYLYDTSHRAFRRDTGHQNVPPHILAPGLFARLTSDRTFKLSEETRFVWSLASTLSIDVPVRINDKAYAAALQRGTGTSLDLSTIASFGGITERSTANLSLDFKGAEWALQPMVYADSIAQWVDPTVAPLWGVNSGVALRLSTDASFTASGGVHAHMSPSMRSNFEAVPEAFMTADLNLTRNGALRLSTNGRYRFGGDDAGWGAWLALSAALPRGFIASARGGKDTFSGATASLSLAMAFGGAVKEPVSSARTDNPVQVNADPARPFLDSRGQDRRYTLEHKRQPKVDLTSVPSALLDHLKRQKLSAPSFEQVLENIPKEHPEWLIAFLDTPEKVSRALDTHIDCKVRGLWPGEEARKLSKHGLHLWAARVLEHHSIDAVVEELTVGDQRESVVIFRDPKSPAAEDLKAQIEGLDHVWRAVNARDYTRALSALKPLFERAQSKEQKVRLAASVHSLRLVVKQYEDIHIGWKVLLVVLGILPFLTYLIIDAKTDAPVDKLLRELEDFKRRLGVSERMARGPSWHAMHLRAISHTDGKSPREALERYASGRGSAVPPDSYLRTPARFQWGPKDAAMRAAHATIRESDENLQRALGDFKSLSYSALADRVKKLAETDPALASGAVRSLMGSRVFTYQFHMDEMGKFTPEEFWDKKSGVCADYHILGAALLRAAGIEARPVEIFGGGLSHVVYAEYDPRIKGWVINDYDTRHQANPPAKTIEEAIASYEPSFDEALVLEADGGRPAVRRAILSAQALVAREFIDRSY